jgi:hypothetical protein
MLQGGIEGVAGQGGAFHAGASLEGFEALGLYFIEPECEIADGCCHCAQCALSCTFATFLNFPLAMGVHNVHNVRMRKGKSQMRTEAAKGRDAGEGRLFTSLNDEELRRRYARMVEVTGVSGPEALRQGLVRLISEFEENGRLEIKRLEPAGVHA